MADSSRSKRTIRFTAIAGSVVLGLWLLSTAATAVSNWQLEKSRVRLTTQEVTLKAASFDALLDLQTSADRYVQAPHKGSYIGSAKQAGGESQPATQEITYNQVEGAENREVRLRYFAKDTRGLYVVEVNISATETSLGESWEQITRGQLLTARDYTTLPNEFSDWTEKTIVQKTESGIVIESTQPQKNGFTENEALISDQIRSEIRKNIELGNIDFEITVLRDESQTFLELVKVTIEPDLRFGERLPLHKVVKNSSFTRHDGTIAETNSTEVITSSGIIVESRLKTGESEMSFKLEALELL